MSAVINNPLVNLFKNLIIVLGTVLVLEICWFTFGQELLVDNNINAALIFDADPLQITPIAEVETFAETVKRSLFSWNRQPKATEQLLVSQESLSSLWWLTGVVITGDVTYAIFSEVNGTRRLRLEQGMSFEQWEVESVTADLVRLTKEGEEELFYLKETDGLTASKTPANNNRTTERKRTLRGLSIDTLKSADAKTREGDE